METACYCAPGQGTMLEQTLGKEAKVCCTLARGECPLQAVMEKWLVEQTPDPAADVANIVSGEGVCSKTKGECPHRQALAFVI